MGAYALIYSVSDKAGNVVEIPEWINVVDRLVLCYFRVGCADTTHSGVAIIVTRRKALDSIERRGIYET